MKIYPVAKSKGSIEINPDDYLMFKNECLIGKDFSRKKLLGMKANNSKFESCKFEKMQIKNICFGTGKEMSLYKNCSFDGATFASSYAGFARFENCSFKNVNIKELFCFATEFINCEFSGKLKKAVFNGTVPLDDQKDIGRVKNEFHGNDFSKLKIMDVGFRRGVDLTKQIFPIDDDYLYIENAEAVLRRARLEIEKWTDPKLKRKADILLNIREEALADGQKQFFIVRGDIMPEIFELLKYLTNHPDD